MCIAEQGSFSRASAILHIAQPALWLHVKNMEDHLGTPLLLRSPKGVVLTEAGASLFRNANTILGQFTVIEEEIRSRHNEPEGEVRTGLPAPSVRSFPWCWCLRCANGFQKLGCGIADAMSGFVLGWLRDGNINIAVLYKDVDENKIETVRILEEDLFFFGPPGG